jgi:hypothetical protein
MGTTEIEDKFLVSDWPVDQRGLAAELTQGYFAVDTGSRATLRPAPGARGPRRKIWGVFGNRSS